MSIPGSASPLFLTSAAAAEPAAYQIDRSLRFDSSASSYLSRTPSSNGNLTTSTFACWVKRCDSGTNKTILAAGNNTQDYFHFEFRSDDRIKLTTGENGSTNQNLVQTEAKFRDPSAWYHVVLQLNFTDATQSDRVKIYVNGTRQTLSGTIAAQNYSGTRFNRGSVEHHIGRARASTAHLDAYLADVHFIDGQALAPTDFGEYDDNNNWNPKAYSGTYGTNGFYLKFADNSSNAALGTDSSGNSNTWTVNNLSVASGAGNDSLIDTPTNYEAASGNNGGNYATLNPLAGSTIGTLSNGNLQHTYNSNNFSRKASTLGVTSGKWYAEFTFQTTGNNTSQCGVVSFVPPVNGNNQNNEETGGCHYNGNNGGFNGTIFVANTRVSTGNTVASNGDIIGVALDADTNNVKFFRNGSTVGSSSGYTATNVSGTWYFMSSLRSNAVTVANFGQRPFAYTPPTGYKSLCTTNLPDPTIADGSTAMDVVTYAGNGNTKTISGVGFSPDFIWIKERTDQVGHYLSNTVVGVNKNLQCNATNTEVTNHPYGYVSAATSDGFTVTAGSSDNFYTNGSPETYVAWLWDAGTSTVSKTNGSITSNVRANPSAGFSIVTYAGTANAETVEHGLNAAPSLIIAKCRTESGTSANWAVYSSEIGASKKLYLNQTIASSNTGNWNSTAPTSSVFSVGGNGEANRNGQDQVAYCFAPVEGYSAFGSYTGNGASGYPNADGPFVYVGFRPRFVLIKATSQSENWVIYDTARSTYNVLDDQLYPNANTAETSGANREIDVYSNGFKIRSNGGFVNTNNAVYLYAAFAEHPFKTARAR